MPRSKRGLLLSETRAAGSCTSRKESIGNACRVSWDPNWKTRQVPRNSPCDDKACMLATDNHEEGAIRAFVQRDKQERFLGFLANPKNRKKFTTSLAHFRWFDRRFATPISWKVDPKLKLWERHVQGIENIHRLLQSKGAGPDVLGRIGRLCNRWARTRLERGARTCEWAADWSNSVLRSWEIGIFRGRRRNTTPSPIGRWHYKGLAA